MAPLRRYLRRLPCLQEGMEEQAQASSPADIAGRGLADPQEEMLRQPSGRTRRKGGVNVRGMGTARQTRMTLRRTRSPHIHAR